MTAVDTARNDLFSIITLGAAPVPDLRTLFGLPERSAEHLACASTFGRRPGRWAVELDNAVLRAERPVLLVASGASCVATAWWARLSPSHYVSRIAGALLFDPLNHALSSEIEGQFRSPRITLPFPSIILNGRGKSGVPDLQTQALANDWGSNVARLPGPAARPGGKWQAAQEVIARATARIVDRRMRVADAFGMPR
jgi:uncharacterized protein